MYDSLSALRGRERPLPRSLTGRADLACDDAESALRPPQRALRDPDVARSPHGFLRWPLAIGKVVCEKRIGILSVLSLLGALCARTQHRVGEHALWRRLPFEARSIGVIG